MGYGENIWPVGVNEVRAVDGKWYLDNTMVPVEGVGINVNVAET